MNLNKQCLRKKELRQKEEEEENIKRNWRRIMELNGKDLNSLSRRCMRV